MSSYPIIKGENTERKLVIRTQSQFFLLVVQENSENANLYIGGANKYCIYAQIIKETSRLRDFMDITIGVLSSLKKHDECAIGSAFKQGETTQLIVHILTSYIAKQYPYVTRLKFTDASTIVCDNGKTISLSELNYMVYGKTWYQRTFHAYLDDKSMALFQEADTKFQALKQHMDWQMFCSCLDNPICTPEWESLYNSAKTWPEFFGPIYKKIGSKLFCNMFSPRWLSSFIEQYSDVKIGSLTYLIPVQQQDVEFTIEPYTSGGRRQRRTRRRSHRLQRIRQSSSVSPIAANTAASAASTRD